jgi:hypothetical protein
MRHAEISGPQLVALGQPIRANNRLHVGSLWRRRDGRPYGVGSGLRGQRRQLKPVARPEVLQREMMFFVQVRSNETDDDLVNLAFETIAGIFHSA